MSQLSIELLDEPPEKTGHCQCCGQKIRKLNPHRMDSSKVALLEYLGKAMASGDHELGWVEVKAGRIAGFRGDEQVHAMRLEWFGLVEHGPRRSGLYRITKSGIDFLRGIGTVPSIIWCKEGRVVESDSTQLNVLSVKNVVLDKAYWDAYPSFQKYAI